MELLGSSDNFQFQERDVWHEESGTRLAKPLIGKGTNFVQLLLLFGAVTLFLIRRYGKAQKKGGRGRSSNIPMVKSPINIPILNGLYNVYQADRCGLKYFENLTKDYGHLYEIPFGLRSVYCVSDPRVIEKLVSSTNPHHWNKAREIREIFLKGVLDDVVFIANADLWVPRRKLLNRSFTHRSLQSYLDLMNKNGKGMIHRMNEEVAPTSGVMEGDVLAEIEFQTCKTMAEIILGTNVMSKEELDIFLNAYKTTKNLILERGHQPHLLLDIIWRFHPKKRQLDEWKTFLWGFIKNIANKSRNKKQNLIKQELGVDDGVKDNLEEELEEDNDLGIKPQRSMIEEMVHGGMSDEQIVKEVIGMILAGHETTSMAFKTLMLFLAQYPECQQNCCDEVDALMESKMLEDDFEHSLTMEDLSSLKYLERCLLENLRLCPTLGVYIRRLDAPLKIDDDLELEGNGKNVLISAWCLHRNPEYYPNPDQFDPDRFLPENVMARQAKAFYSYMAFSAGPKNCIGWKVAMMEMKIAMFWILRNFEIHTTDKQEDVNFRVDIAIKPCKNINLVLKRRNRKLA